MDLSTVDELKKFTQNLNSKILLPTLDIDDDVPSKSVIKKIAKNNLTKKKRKNLPVLCKQCNKTFSSNKSLSTHLILHKKVRPFKCDICLKQFQTKQNLQNHQNIHLGLKPHGCPHCVKWFTEKSTLTKHLLTHTRKKPHCCIHCNKRFTQVSCFIST